MRARCSVLAVLATLVFVGTAQAQARPHDGTYTDPAPRGSTRVMTVVVSGGGHFATVRLGSSLVAHHTPIVEEHGGFTLAYSDQTFRLGARWLAAHPNVVVGHLHFLDHSHGAIGFQATIQA